MIALRSWSDNPLLPQVRKSEYYGVNDLLVTQELVERDKTLFTVQVEPSAEVISTERRFDLVLEYNTSYNVSIQATTCGRYTSSKEIHLMYGKCHKLVELSLAISKF